MTFIQVDVSPNDQLAIGEALRVAFPTRGRMGALLMSCDRTFSEFEVVGSDFRANLLAVVMAAVSEGFILELLDKAVALVPDDALRKLREQIEPATPVAAVDPYAACRLNGRYVMVDRHGLRGALRELNTATGRRILVVNGSPGTGKSHTTQLISHVYLLQVAPVFHFVSLDLEMIPRRHGWGTAVSPMHVARAIVKRLGYPCRLPDEPINSQWSAWVLDFCDDFEALAVADSRRIWLAIDSFDNVVTMQATLDLIKELAYRIDQNLVRFRLVLLGYDDPLSTISQQVEIEALDQIGVTEVVQFFRDASTQLNLAWTDEVLCDVSARVLAGLDPAQDDYLRLIGQRASSELVIAVDSMDRS